MGERELIRLRARVQRRFPLSARTLPERWGATAPFYVPADADAVALSHAETTYEPYWAELWESAERLAEAVAAEGAAGRLRGRHVLDLGCGLGLTGRAAAAWGARVTLVDAAPPALLMARLNTWPWRQVCAVRRLDWRCDALASRFDWILGADILYDRDQWPCLDRFWTRHLARHGTLLLGEPGRRNADHLVPWLARRGWRCAPRGDARWPPRAKLIYATR